MSDDYSDFEIAAPSGDQLKSIEQLASHAYELVQLIDTHEAAIKAAKAELMALTHEALPDAMSAAGTSSFVTDKGVKLTLKDIVQGSLPKDEGQRQQALTWIEEHGGASIIKGTIVAEFERGIGNFEKRNQTAEALANLDVPFIEQETVHAMTLAAFAREKIKAGEDIPLELLGLWAGRRVKVELK
jgi:hypothetical protein